MDNLGKTKKKTARSRSRRPQQPGATRSGTSGKPGTAQQQQAEPLTALIASLSDIERVLVEGYAVVYPQRPARTKMMSWLNKVRRTEEKTGFKSDDIRVAIERLISQGLLKPSVNGKGLVASGPQAVPGTVTRGCLAAIAAGRGYGLLSHATAEYDIRYKRYPAEYYPDRAEHLKTLLEVDYSRSYPLYEQYVRLDMLNGQFDVSLFELLPGGIWNWMSEPAAKPYLLALPPECQQPIFESGLYYLFLNFYPSLYFRKLCIEHAPHPASIAGIAATTLIFEGAFDEAIALFDDMVVDTSGAKALRVARLANQALVETLRGDGAAAFEQIQACLEAEREGTRKRLVFPLEFAFEIAVLGLLREGSQESLQLFNSLVKTHGKLRLTSGIETVYGLVSTLTEDRFVSGRHYQPSGQLIVDVLLAVTSRWHPKFHFTDFRADFRKGGDAVFVDFIQALLSRANDARYRWVVAELLTVLEQSDLPEIRLYGPAQELMKTVSAAALHDEIGSISLCNLVKPLEAWEKSLRSLELLAPAPKKNVSRQGGTGSASKKRIVWQVEQLSPKFVEVVPLEQTLKKTGWTTGRRLGLKRLKNQPEAVAGLSEQDLKAVATIRKLTSYGWSSSGGTRYEADQRTVFQLIGHPGVIDTAGDPVEVVERPAELQIIKTERGIELKIQPEPSGEHYVSSFDGLTNRLEVTHFSAAQRRLFEAVPLAGVAIPEHAKPRLLDAVAALSGDILVQGDAVVADTQAVTGDAATVLELELLDAGIHVRFRVEPLADSATLFDCGSGGALVYVRRDNESIPVSRTLQQEEENLQAVLAASSVLAANFDGRGSATISNIPDALEMLEEIQAIGARCVWPKGKQLSISGHAGSSQLRINIKSAAEWFGTSGELAVDEDQVIALSQLLAFVRQQPESRFMEVGAGDYVALSRSLRRQLQVMAAFAKPPAGKDSEKDNSKGTRLLPRLLLHRSWVTGWKRRAASRRHLMWFFMLMGVVIVHKP